MNSSTKEDPIEIKLNAVFVELLNRLRGPIEKENARAKQVIEQLNGAVRDLRTQIRTLSEAAGDIPNNRS